ncbi:MAG: hypothetical protein ACKOW3_04250 [Hyphomicrobium sp.]
MLVEDLWQIPMSQELATTLTRAIDAAKSQQHVEITLEHLLVSLIDDYDANEMLVLSDVDLQGLIDDALDYTSQLQRGDPPDSSNEILVCNNLKRVLESAATAAHQGGRKEINGAIVFASIVGDGKSIASDLLRAKGLTFEQAIRAIQRALTTSPSTSVSSATPDGFVPNERPQSLEKIPYNNFDQDYQEGQTSFVGKVNSLPNLQTHEGVPSGVFQQAGNSLQRLETPPPKEIQQSAETKAASSDMKLPMGSKGTFSARPPQTGLSQSKLQSGSAALFTMPAGRQQNAGPTPPLSPQREPSHEFQRLGRSAPPSRSVNTHTIPSSNQAGHKSQQVEKVQGPGRERQGAPSSRQKGFPSKGTVRVAASQLAVNLPRRMRILRPVLVEARVPRSDIKAISEGLQDGGAVYRHEIAITKAISVRLRAPQGGFWIENASPETQWVENILGVVSDDFIRWRWTVTPKTRGKKTLQILMSARTVGTDGVAAETALPDQLLYVKVRPNFGKFFIKSFNWLVLFVLLALVMGHWDTLTDKMSGLLKMMGTTVP